MLARSVYLMTDIVYASCNADWLPHISQRDAYGMYLGTCPRLKLVTYHCALWHRQLQKPDALLSQLFGGAEWRRLLSLLSLAAQWPCGGSHFGR